MPYGVRQVRLLRESDDRTTFRSGHTDLDRFFERYAGQNQFRLHIGTTYVAVDNGGTIVGYVTVASTAIETAKLPWKLARRFPKYPIAALRIARMAVARDVQRTGVGSMLMKAVFLIARDQARRTGCAFVVVDAKSGAEAYYQRWGFEAVAVDAGELRARPTPTIMMLEVGAIPDTGEPSPT